MLPMLQTGEPVGDFEGQASGGRTIRLSELKGKPFVAYFYPKSFTSGCTIETRVFAQLYDEFKKADVEVIGISADDLDTQCRFADSLDASFPVVSDVDGMITKAFGLPTLKMVRRVRRVTIIVDEAGLVEKFYSVGFNFSGHPKEVLEYMKNRAPKT